MPHRPRRLPTVLLVALAAAIAAASGAYAAVALRAPADADRAPVVRTALAEARAPAGAPGRTLALDRVTVAPGAELALHRHPGTQASYVARGTLTYWVVRGAVEVRRGDRRVRRIGAGQHGRIRAGERIVERPGTIHHAANRGRRPVVILIASLLRTGAPPSIPVARPPR